MERKGVHMAGKECLYGWERMCVQKSCLNATEGVSIICGEAMYTCSGKCVYTVAMGRLNSKKEGLCRKSVRVSRGRTRQRWARDVVMFGSKSV